MRLICRRHCTARSSTEESLAQGHFWSRSVVSSVSDVQHAALASPNKQTFGARQVFRSQDITIHEQLDLARHWGPLHKQATTPIPKEPGLEEVDGSWRYVKPSSMGFTLTPYSPPSVVYNDSSHRPDTAAFSSLDLWHSDVSYELQPPSTTSLKVITGPEVGGDTLWSSAYALYSSLSPGFQTYLEGLSAVHSGVAQADGARAAGLPIRREPIETVHPVVRVHPTTGWKSIYVNPGRLYRCYESCPLSHPAAAPPGYTQRIVGIPKAESDAILAFLFSQIAQNHTFHVRYRWEVNDVAIWDNRVKCFFFPPSTRLRPSARL